MVSSFRPFALVVVHALAVVEVRGEIRTWTASAGGYTVDADFIELAAGNVVRLKLKTGETRDVPLDRLSAADQEYVRRRTAAPAAASKPLTPAEAAAARAQADQLMKEGLEVFKQGQDDEFRKKFAEAAALEPESIRADFTLAVMYGSSTDPKNVALAVQYYEACLKKDPQNTAALNNMALMAVKARDFRAAVDRWKQAIQIQPEQRILHNIGKLLKAESFQMVAIPKAFVDQLNALYLPHVGPDKVPPTDGAHGYFYLLADGVTVDAANLGKSAKGPPIPGVIEDESCTACLGTGTTECTNSTCVKGVMRARIAGQLLVDKCPSCNGSGRSKCPHCEGAGIDRDVMAGKLDAKAAADKAMNADGGPVATVGDPERDQQPLPQKIVDGLTRLMRERKQDDQNYFGGQTQLFSDAPNEIGILIGLDLSMQDDGGETFINAVRPIFLTASGKQRGKWHGTPGGTIAHIEHPGEAIVEIDVSFDARLKSLSVRMSAFDADGFKAHGSVKPTYGTPIRDKIVELPQVRKRGFIVALNGSTIGTLTERINGLGVTVVPNDAMYPRTISTRAQTGVDEELLSKAPSLQIKGDREQQHPPLSAELADYIRDVVRDGKTINHSANHQVGTRDVQYRDAPADGALLIGFDIAFGQAFGKPHIQAFRPIWLTRTGKVKGTQYGAGGQGLIHIEAKPGYAIGRYYCKAGTNIHAITMTYLKIGPNGLDPSDAYEGPAYGVALGQNRQQVGRADGSMIVGLIGMQMPGEAARSPGGMTVKAKEQP